MRRFVWLILGAALWAQSAQHETLRNAKVIVAPVRIAPGATVPMHTHQHDVLTVAINDGQLKDEIEHWSSTEPDRTSAGNKVIGLLHFPGHGPDKVSAGDVDMHQAGFAHSLINTGKTPLYLVDVEFLKPAGQQRDAQRGSNRYCNPGNKKACVDEKYLFCTNAFCVEDVTMSSGARTTKHSHSTDHMLIAITDYQLSDSINGQPPKVRARRSGEVEYIPSGISHQLTNSGKKDARFIVVLFN